MGENCFRAERDMREISYEETAFPYDYKRQKVFYAIDKVLIVLFSLVFAFWVFVFLFLTPMTTELWWLFPVMNMAGCVATVVFLFLIKGKFYNCYDYIFVTGDVRIIKVVNTKRRKKVVVFDCKNVYGVGRYESETYEKIKNSPDVKVLFVPTNKYVIEKPKYYIATVVDGVKYLLVLECTEKFLSYVLSFSSKQVLEKEF